MFLYLKILKPLHQVFKHVRMEFETYEVQEFAAEAVARELGFNVTGIRFLRLASEEGELARAALEEAQDEVEGHDASALCAAS